MNQHQRAKAHAMRGKGRRFRHLSRFAFESGAEIVGGERDRCSRLHPDFQPVDGQVLAGRAGHEFLRRSMDDEAGWRHASRASPNRRQISCAAIDPHQSPSGHMP
jgi:hypothetical protein